MQNKGMQSSLRYIERHKHKHKNIVEAYAKSRTKDETKKNSRFIFTSQRINHALFSYRSCAYAYVASVNQALALPL